MERVEVSLRKQYKKQMAIIFAFAFFIIVLMSLWLTNKHLEQSYQKRLSIHHTTVTQAFNDYLQLAEYELNSTAQLLLFNQSKIQPEPALDILFDQYDDFLLGGVDFFYVKWADGTDITDPRSNLFFYGNNKEITKFSTIGGWSLKQTIEGESLLIYKKSLGLQSGEWKGYLYGFIVLQKNVTLLNALLSSADLDRVKLLSSKQDVLLSGLRNSLVNNTSVEFYSADMLLSKSDETYTLQIAKQKKVAELVWQNYLFWIITLMALLYLMYVISLNLCQRLAQTVLTTFEQDLEVAEDSSFIELHTLQRRLNEKYNRLNSHKNSFNLLMSASEAAIIFCDEIACIQKVNPKAEAIFPESSHSRTVFDFMPVECHQSIQQALKGEIGININTTLANTNRIYCWKLFPYMMDSDYRGLALIGHDVTDTQQLEWQLNELQQYIPENSVATPLILDELSYILTDAENTFVKVKDIWLKSLTYCLKELIAPQTFSNVIAFGELLTQRLTITPSRLTQVDYVQIDCSIDSANVHSAWSSDVGLLVSALIMMAHSSDVVGKKHLLISVVDNQLKIETMGIGASRPVFNSLVYAITARLGIECKLTTNNQLTVLYPFLEKPLVVKNPIINLKVVWIKNDYVMPTLIEDILNRLGYDVSVFSSTESFFTEIGELALIDVLLIGYHERQPIWQELPVVLKTRLSREKLPIGWIGPEHISLINEHPNYSSCLHEYGLSKFMEPLIELDPIDLSIDLLSVDGWLVVGGSNVSRAILYEELLCLNVRPYLVPNLEDHQSLFVNDMVRVVLLLDDVDEGLIEKLCKQCPKLVAISLSVIANNDVTSTYLLEKPYRKIQIQLLVEFVDKKITEYEE